MTISEIAAEKGKQILTAEGKSQGGLRVYLAGGGCCGPSFGMDINEAPADGDEVIEKNGLKVFVEKAALDKLSGMEMDFVQEGESQGFVIRNPQPPSCGPTCGSGACG
jgi:iron-sulfur cluster assembly accessory protein